ncbi:protein YacH [Enterobacter asburiae]|uniref:Protein YacH n=1 Tax=Enterobacter asburiae TaxID=61645 RepID=A0A376FK93_ENTAS|nr:protein YacH [Enterobacter asburiae]
MKLPFKPHLLVLLCSAGLFAASGVMFVKGRATEPAAPAPSHNNRLHRQRLPQPSPPLLSRQPTLPRKSINGLLPSRSTRMPCCRKF